MLASSLDERLLAIVGRNARELRCVMLAAGCASDHMHVVVRLASSVSLGELVRHLKGASSHELNHDSSWTHRLAWQDGYWAESIGPADLDPIARYVRGQRDHHDASHPAERWAGADIADPFKSACYVVRTHGPDFRRAKT